MNVVARCAACGGLAIEGAHVPCSGVLSIDSLFQDATSLVGGVHVGRPRRTAGRFDTPGQDDEDGQINQLEGAELVAAAADEDSDLGLDNYGLDELAAQQEDDERARVQSRSRRELSAQDRVREWIPRPLRRFMFRSSDDDGPEEEDDGNGDDSDNDSGDDSDDSDDSGDSGDSDDSDDSDGEE